MKPPNTDFGADFGLGTLLDQCSDHFGSIFDPRSLIIHWQGHIILHFSDFSKNCKNGAPGPTRGVKKEAKIASWAPFKSDHWSPKSALAAPGRGQEFILAP